MAPAIVIRAIRKQYGALVALDGIDLTVGEGEVVALMGPNGAGKTTLLRILATTVTPDTGQALVAGHDVRTAARAVRQRIGLVVGDERGWYWRLSGLRNLEFFAALHSLAPDVAAARAGDLLEEHGLGAAADRRVSDYSSGMRLRLALARALLGDPEVLLLDEPTRSLDVAGTDSLRHRLATLASERGVSALIATHDLDDARSLADRTVLLDAGRVVASVERDAVEDLTRRLSAAAR